MEKHIFTIPHECLPQVKARWPFIYLEHGRLEIDDRSVKFISAEDTPVAIPCGCLNCILLGPGTTVTHDAVKILAEVNCSVFFVGEEGIKFYAVGLTPTSTSKNFTKQMELASSKAKSLEIAKKMFAKRFPEVDLNGKTLEQLKGMEGIRVKSLYESLAKKHNVFWDRRKYDIEDFSSSDDVNKYLTVFNMFLYAVCCSAVLSMGFSPYIGFVHRSSPLPFIYDIADLYKADLSINPAFQLADVVPYSKDTAERVFLDNCKKFQLLKQVSEDLEMLFNLKE